DLLDLIDRTDPALGTDPPPLYAATCRGRKSGRRPFLDTWFHPLAVGRPLPTLPLWLSEDTGAFLDLEATYEGAGRSLRVRCPASLPFFGAAGCSSSAASRPKSSRPRRAARASSFFRYSASS